MTYPQRHRIQTFMRQAEESGHAECWYCGTEVFRFMEASRPIRPNHATFDHFISKANLDEILRRAEMFGVVACSQCNNEKSLYSDKLTKYFFRKVQATHGNNHRPYCPRFTTTGEPAYPNRSWLPYPSRPRKLPELSSR